MIQIYKINTSQTVNCTKILKCQYNSDIKAFGKILKKSNKSVNFTKTTKIKNFGDIKWQAIAILL